MTPKERLIRDLTLERFGPAKDVGDKRTPEAEQLRHARELARALEHRKDDDESD